jgi:flagellar hook-associated protein 3 FlgL
MRVGGFTVYDTFVNNQQRNLSDIVQLNTQISSGKKIQNGYEDTNIFIDTLRLTNEKATLEQISDTTQKARTFSDNTDVALGQMKDALGDFKTKLIQGANGVHSNTSIQAIANDLQALKEHMLNTANTSINGNFLFAGTNVKTKPFDDEGTYFGNEERLKAHAGDRLQIAYNIDGGSLFFGDDSDYNKKITTNVTHLNQVDLHKRTLELDDPEGDNVETKIGKTDTIRAYIGQPDDTKDTIFYIRGRKPDGEGFKDKVTMTNGGTVDDLLDKIGRTFGNTQISRVVDVQLSPSGAIEISDIKSGQMMSDFHMIASDTNVNSLDELAELDGVHLFEFNKSGFSYPKTHDTLKASQDFYTDSLFKFNGTLSDSKTLLPAQEASNARAILGSDVDQITINVNGTDTTHSVTALTKISAILENIKDDILAQTGSNVDVSIVNGEISVFDLDASDSNAINRNDPNFTPTKIDTISFTTKDSLTGNNIKAFSDANALGYDQARFEKKGAVLTSNVSQLIRSNNEFASEGTSLNVVSGSDSLDEKTYVLDFIDVNGKAKKMEINFRDVPDANGHLSTFQIVEPSGGAIFDIFDEFGEKSATKSYTSIREELSGFESIIKEKEVNGLTYKQFFNVMQVAIADELPVSNDFDGFKAAIAASENVVDVTFDARAKMTVKDLTTSESKIQLSLYDTDSNRFDKYNKSTDKGWLQTYEGIKKEQGWDILESNTSKTLDRVFGFSFPSGVTLEGTDANGNATSVTVNETDTLQTLLDQMDSTFGDGTANSEVRFFVQDGRILTKDNSTNNPTQINIDFKFSDAQVDMRIENSPPLSFAANNALTIDEPRVNFFDKLQDAIDGVRARLDRPDGNAALSRNIGIQNSITAVDHLFDHIVRKQTENGSNGQSLSLSFEKSEITILNVAQLQSQVLDTDIGEAVAKMSQRTVQYQAMLSTIGRVNQLSLLNYI